MSKLLVPVRTVVVVPKEIWNDSGWIAAHEHRKKITSLQNVVLTANRCHHGSSNSRFGSMIHLSSKLIEQIAHRYDGTCLVILALLWLVR